MPTWICTRRSFGNRANRSIEMQVGQEEVNYERIYKVAFVTAQGVGLKYGNNRMQTGVSSIESMRNYLAIHSPLDLGLESTFVAV